MTDSSSSWWKFPFMRKSKSQTKVLNEISPDSNSTSGQHSSAGAVADATQADLDLQLEARLERIVDKSGTRGRNVKVSHSGRYREKKKARPGLGNQELVQGDDSAVDKNQTSVRK